MAGQRISPSACWMRGPVCSPRKKRPDAIRNQRNRWLQTVELRAAPVDGVTASFDVSGG
nr:hypothetical protein [Rhodovibrio salinarum]